MTAVPQALLRALVLEDERAARSYLVELIEASGLAQVVAAVSSVSLARAATKGDEIDVAFVDVHLVGEADAERAGLGFAQSLLKAEGAPRIVLTTASPGHALEAFELGVVDYLLKPFVASRVRDSLARIHEQLPAPLPARARAAPRIAARKGRGYVFLGAAEATAFEAEGRLSYVHAGGSRYDVDLSLSAIEALVGDEFLRVHRNWLVRCQNVREVERDGGEMTLVLHNDSGAGLRVPVARDRISVVRHRLLSETIGLRRDD
jgi:DNA-binding LytR/AlgR family response regulator